MFRCSDVLKSFSSGSGRVKVVGRGIGTIESA